ncbi:uncharacterized protein LOC129583905 isoform X2 [Paramacrobiotus metropolitanus]|uniref:uncharacterized protein LOC129583905 isoform X2 n=1 Tax=Paramacrobiotus metropolitanus TaxID=2943436 RepID=UPI0024461564|nr:uncharacterized protein LOC129583905 isoform X2 [Paramacrobiotus metropolitanus]
MVEIRKLLLSVGMEVTRKIFCFSTVGNCFLLFFTIIFLVKQSAAAVRCASTDKTPYTGANSYSTNYTGIQKQPQKLSANYTAFADEPTPYSDRLTYQNRSYTPYRNDYYPNNYYNRSVNYDRGDYNDRRPDTYDRYNDEEYYRSEDYRRPNRYYNSTGSGYYPRNYTASRMIHNDTGYNWTMGYDGRGTDYSKKKGYRAEPYDDRRYDGYADRYSDDRDNYESGRMTGDRYRDDDYGRDDYDSTYRGNYRYNSSGPYRSDRYRDYDNDNYGRYNDGRYANDRYDYGRNDSYALGRNTAGRDYDRYDGRDRYGYDNRDSYGRNEQLRGPEYDRYGKINPYGGSYNGGYNGYGQTYNKPQEAYGSGYDCPIQTKETKSSHADIPTTSASAIVSIPTGDFILYCSQHPAKTILAYPLYCSGYGDEGMGKDATPTLIDNTCFDIRVVDDLNNLEKPNHLIIALTKAGHSAAYQVDYSSSTLKLLPCLHVFEYKYLVDFESVPLGHAGTLLAFANNNVEPTAAYHESVQPLYIAKDGKIALCGFADIQNVLDVTAWKKSVDSIILVYSQRRGNTRRTLLHLFEIRFKDGYCDVRPYKHQKTIGAAVYDGQRNTLCAYEPFTIDQCLCGVEDLQILRAPHYHKTVHLGVALSNNVKYETDGACPVEERLQPDNQYDKSFCCCPLANQRSFIIEYSGQSRSFDFMSDDDNAFQTLYAGPESATEISQLQTEKCCPVFQTISPVGETSLYTLEQNRYGGWQVYQFINHGLPSYAESSSFGYCDDNDVIVSYTLHSFQADNTIYHIRCNWDGKYSNDAYKEKTNYVGRTSYTAPSPYALAPAKTYTSSYNNSNYKAPTSNTPAAYPTPSYTAPAPAPVPAPAPYAQPAPSSYAGSPAPAAYAYNSPNSYAAAKVYYNGSNSYNTTYNNTNYASKPKYDYLRANYTSQQYQRPYNGTYRHGFGNDLYNADPYGHYGNYSMSRATYGPQLYSGGYAQPGYNVYQPAPLSYDMAQYAPSSHTGIRFTNSTRGGYYSPSARTNGR